MKDICFIVNPISGGKDKSGIVASVRKHLDASLYRPTFHFTERAGEAESFAHNCKADVVVAVGGDGTVSEVARGLVGTEKTLGIIPCGSGDGLALHLGISRTPAKAVKTLNEAAEARIDVASLNGRPFFCTAGMGLDADVSLDFARSTQRGLARYIELAWEEWKHHPGDQYTITSDTGETWSGKAVFVTIANANQWGNQARIAPMASLQDGLLDAIVVRPFSTVEIPDLAARLMTGLAPTSRHFLHFSGSQISIHRELSGAVHCDGDPFEDGTDFTLSVMHAALKVLVPSTRIAKI
jgi:YegS/Rv2252/BmrU family lipid kinase